jgi:hypothetical protein
MGPKNYVRQTGISDCCSDPVGVAAKGREAALEDHLPIAEIIHDVVTPGGDPWNEALSLTRLNGRWSQHLGSVLGQRHGRLVEVWVVQSYDPDQDTGVKGYLEDDEIIWRIEAVCFPLNSPIPEGAALIGNSLISQGRYCLELPVQQLCWSVGDLHAAEGASLQAEAFLLPWVEVKPPDAQLRYTVRRATLSDPDDAAGWVEALGSTVGSHRWQRRVNDDLIEVEVELSSDLQVLRSLANNLLGSFWVVG